MKVWMDIISGDEMVSDSYPHKYTFGDACLEVSAKYTTKGSDQIAIASDDVMDEEGGGDTVVDLVDAFQYNELPAFAKKDFMMWCKGYLGSISKKLEEAGKGDQVADFKKNATELVKYIVSKYDEMQVFAGKKFDMDAGLCVAFQKEQDDAGPTFLFFAHGMKEEKF